MIVKKMLTILSKEVMMTGLVRRIEGGSYIVTFSHDGVGFAGSWKMTECEILPCPRDTDGDGNCGSKHCPYCGEIT